jgi:hypothetical protein
MGNTLSEYRGCGDHGRSIGSCLLVFLLSVSLGACGDSQEASNGYTGPPQKTDPDETLILVDRLHSYKQNVEMRMVRGKYSYQGMFGFYRLFEHLSAHGYPSKSIVHQDDLPQELTPETLADYDVLFVNLVSDNMPDFSEAEVVAIREFVADGGGLLVISDHSNVYHHAERINPILEPMGIEVTYHTALDKPPDNAILGWAWIKINNFLAGHPLTEGIDQASFLTGGIMSVSDGAKAIGWTSEDGYGDFWNEDSTHVSLTGNFSYDEGEPKGNLPVIAAAEYGEGRVVVVGDQNIFGDLWLHAVDNFELALNAFEWLAKKEGSATPLRAQPLVTPYTVGFDLHHTRWNVAHKGCRGFAPFYFAFNRSPDVSAKGLTSFVGTEDALVFPDPETPYGDDELAEISSYLDNGKTLVIVTDVVSGSEGARQLLAELVPDFEVDVMGQTLFVDDLPVDGLETSFVGTEEFPLSSPVLDVSALKAAGHQYPEGSCNPETVEERAPVLRKLTSSWGEPFLQAEVDGAIVDLIRTKEVGKGTMIVFLQDDFVRNQTLGGWHQVPNDSNRGSHLFVDRMVDYLSAVPE